MPILLRIHKKMVGVFLFFSHSVSYFHNEISTKCTYSKDDPIDDISTHQENIVVPRLFFLFSFFM